MGAGPIRYFHRGGADGLAGGSYFAGDPANFRHCSRNAADHGRKCLHKLVLRRPFANCDGQIAIGDFLGGRSYFVHGGDERIQIVFDGIEVTMIGVGDLRGNVALADLLHVFGRNIQAGR